MILNAALPPSSVLAVPEVHGDELHTVHPLYPGSNGGLVEGDLVDVGAWLANLQHPGDNLLVSRLGEERVQIVQQHGSLTPWLLRGHHHQLVSVDFQTGDPGEISGESLNSVLDELAGLGTEESELHPAPAVIITVD